MLPFSGIVCQPLHLFRHGIMLKLVQLNRELKTKKLLEQFYGIGIYFLMRIEREREKEIEEVVHLRQTSIVGFAKISLFWLICLYKLSFVPKMELGKNSLHSVDRGGNV